MSCLKKVSLSVAALAVSASVFAGTDLDSRVRELEKEMKQVRTETTHKTFGANTATARPSDEEAGFILSFDVLYWQVKTSGTEFGTLDTISGDPFLPDDGRLLELDYNKWNWGFRAGAGYNFTHGQWDVYANYTYFTANGSKIVSSSVSNIDPQVKLGSSARVALSTTPGFVASYADVYNVGRASSEFKFNFNRVDLELGRDFFVAKYLSLRPHVGLMTAWIHHDQTTQYSGADLLTNAVTVKDKNHFWGIGPRGGLNTTWYLCNGFSVIGNMSGALTYGKFDLSYDQTFSLTPQTNYVYVNGDMHRFVPNSQIQLGFGYDTTFSCDTQRFSASLAWDIQYWWRVQQQIKRNLNNGRQGDDLSLQGITLHLRWDF